MENNRDGAVNKMPVAEAIRYIREYEDAAHGIEAELCRERQNMYMLYAVDGKILSEEERAEYGCRTAASGTDVERTARLLVELADEIARLKRLVSQALGREKVEYDWKRNTCMHETVAERLEFIISRREFITHDSLRDAKHMSPKDEIQDYRYPVTTRKKLVIDKDSAKRLAAKTKRTDRGREDAKKEAMERLSVEYEPRFDIHADWHRWQASIG